MTLNRTAFTTLAAALGLTVGTDRAGQPVLTGPAGACAGLQGMFAAAAHGGEHAGRLLARTARTDTATLVTFPGCRWSD